MGVRVWRVEDEDGNGPYHRADRLEKVFGDNWDHVSWRNPQHGGVTDADVRRGIYFVFLSKRQLLDWFDITMLKTLIRLGYRVCSYVVDGVIVGDRQGAVRGLVWRERKPRW